MSTENSEKGYEANQIEQRQASPEETRQGRQGGIKRHCARFWWLHLIIFCVVFLIIALCLVYVAFPHIAQKGVNGATITITQLQFLDPTPNSVVLTQQAVLHSTSMYTPTLDPFNATIYLVTNGTFDTAILDVIALPSIHATKGNSTVSVINQPVAITDQDELARYATQVLTQENVTMALTGKTSLHEGKLPVTHIKFNTSTTYKTLNGLQGFNMTNAKINITAAPGEPNLTGLAYIPNPSDLTIALGNVTLSIATAKGGIVGNATILDMTIVPGDNSLPMTAVLNQTAIIAGLNATGFADLIVTGTSAVYNGQHITYYEKALASNVLTLSTNVLQIIADSA